jgi:plasmid stability protein
MAMTLRLTEEEQDALRTRAALDGTSMQEAARRAVREYVAKADHRDRVATAAELIMQRHADALRRLGE